MKREMENLLTETRKAIKESGHVPADIIFIGSEESGHQCDWEEFKVLANREYDCGYGGARVAMDLIIVFSDGSKMWRGEYDGSEWWELPPAPFKKPEKVRAITSLFANPCWEDLAEINK